MMSSNSQNLINECIEHLQLHNPQITKLGGGDINESYRLLASLGDYFLKINSHHGFIDAEYDALNYIGRVTENIFPEVIHYFTTDDGSGLVMDFMEPVRARDDDYYELGNQLFRLHQVKNEQFGWHTNNYIGRLGQENPYNTSWVDFYFHNRILPQLKLTVNNQYFQSSDFLSEEHLHQRIATLMPKDIVPVLLHGDLWAGNYLVAKDGSTFLIDPASYFGHYEVDLAMTKLFGGFNPAFYEAYYERVRGKISGEGDRANLYQLFYLLVHLNMFGSSYKSGVDSLIKQVFR